MVTQILWHGHSNMQITSGGVSVLIDPFFTGNPTCTISWRDAPKPDVVLITHDHGDHVGDAIAICRSTGALCGCVYDTASDLMARGLPDQLVGAAFNLGGTVNLCGVSITMTPAFHTSESGAPAGYVLRMPDGFTVYHAGDTCLFGDMALIGAYHKIDVALLPIGDVFTMDPRQAAHACTLLKPQVVIPMHWGTFPPLVQSPDEFARLAAVQTPQTRVVCLKPGESVTL